MFQISDPSLYRLAEAILKEITKQFDIDGPSAPMVCGEAGLRDVLVEGHIDLIRVAAALSARCCVQAPDVETVQDFGAG